MTQIDEVREKTVFETDQRHVPVRVPKGSIKPGRKKRVNFNTFKDLFVLQLVICLTVLVSFFGQILFVRRV